MFTPGQTPAALRQRSGAAFAGEKPLNATAVVFEPFAVAKILTYVNPADQTESALTQAGLYDFGDAAAVRILEVRALTAMGNISAIVTDRRDVQTMDLAVGGATPAINLAALGVDAGCTIEIVSPAGTENYIVAQVNSATQLETEENISARALVAADSFTITSRRGVVLYTHTLAGVDTLDVDFITVHDTPVGTPATSLLQFAAPLIVLPHQVLKVSTAGAHATGRVDVYAVKADFY